MSNVLIASRGGVGPSLWLNHKWGFRYDDPDTDFSAASISIYLDLVGAETPTRVTLTHASTGVTRADGYVDCDQAASWVAANLAAGTWKAHLLSDGYELAWWTFQVVTPDAGGFTPS